MASMPAASAIWASRIFSAKVFCQRSGTVVAARPLEQLEPKTASLNRLPPNMVGLRSTSITSLSPPLRPCRPSRVLYPRAPPDDPTLAQPVPPVEPQHQSHDAAAPPWPGACVLSPWRAPHRVTPGATPTP